MRNVILGGVFVLLSIPFLLSAAGRVGFLDNFAGQLGRLVMGVVVFFLGLSYLIDEIKGSQRKKSASDELLQMDDDVSRTTRIPRDVEDE